jgi:hypothetical protein
MKVNQNTYNAWQGSIKKWESIVDGSGVDEGTRNCPLCKLFYHNWCKDCPIHLHTGFDSCDKTPYEKWSDLIKVFTCPPFRADTPEKVEVAKAELEFLKSLPMELEDGTF